MAKRLIFLLLLYICIPDIQAQAFFAARTSATIVEPIGLDKLEDLSFGDFDAPSTDGTITLSNSNARLITGGFSKKKSNTPYMAAVIDIYTADYFYFITTPEERFTVKRANGNETMEIKDIVLEENNLGEGEMKHQRLIIGATLYVNKKQPAGSYHPETPLTVVINYN